jgi:hypothetical protein
MSFAMNGDNKIFVDECSSSRRIDLQHYFFRTNDVYPIAVESILSVEDSKDSMGELSLYIGHFLTQNLRINLSCCFEKFPEPYLFKYRILDSFPHNFLHFFGFPQTYSGIVIHSIFKTFF